MTYKPQADAIIDGTIVDADVNAAAAIALSKLAVDPLARANHTGTQTASTISDFDTQVQTSRLDQMAAPTASVSMNSQLLTNLATPVSATDAASKGYVDAIEAGLDVKESVRAASTADIDLTTGGLLTIDGVSLSSGDRVLVKDQSTASENGIYDAAAGAWSRSSDADTDAEVTSGLFTFVEEGTAAGDTGWVLTTNDPITVDTTALTFTQFTGVADLVAGDGLTKTANTIDVVGGDGITANANDIQVDSTVVRTTGTQTVGGDKTYTGVSTFQDDIIQTAGGNRRTLASVAVDTSLDAGVHYIVIVDSSGAIRTMTLPATHSAGQMFHVKRSGANNVVIATADADTIDGAASYTLSQDLQSATVVSDGTNWLII